MGDTDASERGVVSYTNWKAFVQGIPVTEGQENLLYSDSTVCGEVRDGWGPYQVINTFGGSYQPGCVPVLCLRINWHSQFPTISIGGLRSDTSHYHGGSAEDEISALIGLALRIRLRPGGVVRKLYNNPHCDRPFAENPADVPILLHDSSRPRIIPVEKGQIEITGEVLKGFSELPSDAATALVRSARLFQNGLWLSESSPNDAWLMFVSAIEVASVYWRDESGDPEGLLRSLEPQWAQRLDATGDPSVTADMGKYWKRLLRSTKRFVDLLMEYMPESPDLRPTRYPLAWEDEPLRKAIKRIYRYRSEALHSGVPFPAPLCTPLEGIREDEVLPERPHAVMTWCQNASWHRKDLPMYLHMFAYMVHGALLNWWNELKKGRGRAVIDAAD